MSLNRKCQLGASQQQLISNCYILAVCVLRNFSAAHAIELEGARWHWQSLLVQSQSEEPLYGRWLRYLVHYRQHIQLERQAQLPWGKYTALSLKSGVCWFESCKMAMHNFVNSLHDRTWFGNWPKNWTSTSAKCKFCAQRRTPWRVYWLWRPRRFARLWPTRTSKWRRKWNGTTPTKRQRTRDFNSKWRLSVVRRPPSTCNYLSWSVGWPSWSCRSARKNNETNKWQR